MHLINTTTNRLEEFIGDNVPAYAILSHTWNIEEVTHKDFAEQNNLHKKGWEKIWKTCTLAQEANLKYVWVDTICIDKSSSAELSEAINSMFQWYEKSQICFAWLSDWDDEKGHELRNCRWFTRGWTLQELIAPKTVIFYDSNWTKRGTKATLVKTLSARTKVDTDLLLGSKSMSDFTVAQKMSWAAGRRTTRKEDMAYSLLGIFDLNMPLLYGEGDKAFRRLQEEIIKSNADLTIFAWKMSLDSTTRRTQFRDEAFPLLCGVWANSPDDFSSCNDYTSGIDGLREVSSANLGIKIRVRMHLHLAKSDTYVIPVAFRKSNYIGVRIRQIGHEQYLRQDPYTLMDYSETHLYRILPPVERFLLTRIPDGGAGALSKAQMAPVQNVLPKCRAFVLSFEAGKNTSLSEPWPLHRFDHTDMAFIGPQNSQRDFGVIIVRAHLPVHAQYEQQYIICRFLALGWYQGDPQFAEFGLLDCSEFSSEYAPIEPWMESWDRSTVEFLHRLQEVQIPKRSAVIKDLGDTGDIAFVSFKVEPQETLGVCTHVNLKVTFTCDIYQAELCPEYQEESWMFRSNREIRLQKDGWSQ